MSFFEGQTPSWVQQGREQSYEQSQGRSSPVPGPVDVFAFTAQFEEIERASDNLLRTGKGAGAMQGRRESSAMVGGAFAHQHPGYGPPSRHHQVNDYDGMRSHSSHSSSSVQGYLTNQRFGSRPSEAEQMMQAKRRAAAQREKDLRNYHQEQQYNRNLSGAKADPNRATSPGASSEEERRALIARQHRALYGDGSLMYSPDGSRPVSQDARVLAAGGPHGPSFDNFASQIPGDISAGSQQGGELPTASKSPNTASTFAMFDNTQQAARTSTSSPGGVDAPGAGGVGLIGSRQPQLAGLKRNSPPTASPLGFGFNGDKANVGDRSASAASNPAVPGADGKPLGLGWGAANNGPWGPNKPHPHMGAQASVWG